MRLRFWKLMLAVTYWIQLHAWSLYVWACSGERDELRRLDDAADAQAQKETP